MRGLRGLEGTNTLITGAASGIGRALASRLAEEGAVIGILDRNGEAAQRCAEALGASRGLAYAYEADITDLAAVERAVRAFEADTGPIGALVNNAGWDHAQDFLQTDPGLWRRVIDVNLYGPLNVTRTVLAGMVERGRGRVVSIASDAARVGSSGEAVYAACKAGIIAFSKSVAREVARSGVTLNAVSPGPTDTPLFASFDPTGRLAQALERAIPMRRLGRPEDCAGLVAFLLSDEAGFMTGQTISVSGGLTMQ